MRKIIIFVIIPLLAIAVISCKSKVKTDAERLAELFCKQSKIVEQATNLNDSTVQKQLDEIESEAAKINEDLQNTYSKDIDAMETFAKMYQEGIKNCK